MNHTARDHQQATWQAQGLGLKARYWDSAAATGPVCLLLHGFTGTAAIWEPLINHLPASWRAIGIDLPGHGDSEWPKQSIALRHVADALAASLQARELGPVVLVGYSLGGRLALQLALGHPQTVRHLMLVSASPGLDGVEQRSERRERDARWAALLRSRGVAGFIEEWDQQALFTGGRSLGEAQRAWWRTLRLGQSPEALARAIEAFSPGREPFLDAALSGLQMPAELVVGGQDARYVAVGQAMARLIHDSRLHVLEGVAHNVPLEAPIELAQLITGSLLREGG